MTPSKKSKRLLIRLKRVKLSVNYGKKPVLYSLGKAPGELVSLR